VVFVVASRPDPSGALAADGSPLLTPIFASVIAPGESASAPGAGFSVKLESIGSYTGIIARRDPGAPIIWLAAALIVGGLAFTLRRPRTRLWLRVTPGSREVDAALLVDRGADPVSSARTLERVAVILGGESA
jgi:cytochrome c biogenesis protein